MRRVAVFGGSFDPPHVGHLLATAWVRWTGRADEVWWLPVAAHAFGKSLAPFPLRLDWCARCTADLPWVSVDPVESTLPAPSYTIDTLRALEARHADVQLRLVVGADILPDTPRWRAWDELARRYDPIVVGRQGWPTPAGAIDLPGVASREIRAAIRAGDPVEAWVPEAIRGDVERWYRTAPDGG